MYNYSKLLLYYLSCFMMRINDYEGISVLPEVRVLPYTYGSTEVRRYLFSFVRKYFRKYFRAFVLSTFVQCTFESTSGNTFVRRVVVDYVYKSCRATPVLHVQHVPSKVY